MVPRFSALCSLLGLILVSGAASTATTGRVSQEGISREDAAAILFSNHFAYTEHGEPILPVALMEEQKRIRFHASEGVSFLPSGHGGPVVRMKGKGVWTATIEESRPAKVGYRVVLRRLPTRDFEAVRQAVKDARALGLEPVQIELGAVFSFEGTVFDSRETLVCDATAFSSRKQAREQARVLVPGAEPDIQEVLLERPEGLIRVRSDDGQREIEARNAVWLDPLGDVLTVEDVEFGKGFRWHGTETRKFAGTFYLAVDKTGELAIVNVLPAEQLLRGVVPAEIYSSSPPEALKAQAVAARNELFSKIGHRHLADPFLLCATQHCQVYKGVGAEKSSTNAAVEKTRGRVLFNELGRLADCRYHSTDGGHTENAEEAWPGTDSPELRGRFTTTPPPKDPYAPLQESNVRQFLEKAPDCVDARSSKTRSTFRWTESFSSSRMDEQVRQEVGIRHLEKIEVLHRGVSGRANHLRLSGGGKSVEIRGELVIRKLFFGLKSSLFVVDAILGDGGRIKEWKFTGGGFGHGVGMSQNGAAQLAQEGKSFEEILHYYYHKVSLGRLY